MAYVLEDLFGMVMSGIVHVRAPLRKHTLQISKFVGAEDRIIGGFDTPLSTKESRTVYHMYFLTICFKVDRTDDVDVEDDLWSGQGTGIIADQEGDEDENQLYSGIVTCKRLTYEIY